MIDAAVVCLLGHAPVTIFGDVAYICDACPLHLFVGDNEKHWGACERYFSGKSKENVFVLDFTKPRGTLDPAYPIVKQLLTKVGIS